MTLDVMYWIRAKIQCVLIHHVIRGPNKHDMAVRKLLKNDTTGGGDEI